MYRVINIHKWNMWISKDMFSSGIMDIMHNMHIMRSNKRVEMNFECRGEMFMKRIIYKRNINL